MQTPNHFLPLYKQPRFWLLPGLASLFLLATLILLFILQDREHQIRNAEWDDSLWASFQLDRENQKFANELSLYLIQPEPRQWANVELRFEILYSRTLLLKQESFLYTLGLSGDTVAQQQTRTALQLIEKMDKLFATNQSDTPEGKQQLLELSKRLQQITDPLASAVKGIRSQLNTEGLQHLQLLYRILGGVVLILILIMSLIITLLIRKMLEARNAQYHAQQMAAELEVTASQAEAASRAKSDFLATLGHEIRTPMNGVLGLADLLRETPLTEEQRKYTDGIFNSAHSLMQLLNDLMDISRLEAGKLTLDDRETRLAPLLQEVMDFFATGLDQKPIRLEWELQPDADHSYQVDPLRLRQVLLNLLGNALKFTQQGRVWLQVRQEIDGLHFAVQDTGPGIPEDVQQRLFELFTQADSSISRRYGGTGLGLAISRQIVEQMGGHIGVVSTLGKGSCFYFTLPLQPLDHT